jgi:fused signal recognition particle receptor
LIDRLSSLGIAKKKWSKRDVLNTFNELEIEFLSRGIPPSLLEKLRDLVSIKLEGVETKGDPREVVRRAVRESILEITPRPVKIEDLRGGGKLFRVVFFGFNGVGKSLSIVKLAKYLQDMGSRVLVVSADTYRAAAGEQLEGYCKAAGITIFKGQRGSDPSAVCFDAMNMALARGYSHLLIDTAGRNYLNRNLIDELKKIVRVVEPDLRVLVLDGIAGNDVLSQCDSFNEVGYDAIIVTKVDAGGLIVPLFASIHSGKPVLFLGTGQRFSDIAEFDPIAAVEIILGS